MRNATADHRAMASCAALAALLAVATCAVPAAAAELVSQPRVRPILTAGSYFPLRPGYRWVYHTSGPIGEPRTWQVQVLDRPAAPTLVAERFYLPLVGYFHQTARLVRSDPFANVFERSGERREHLWYLLNAPAGTSWKLTTAPPEGIEFRKHCQILGANRQWIAYLQPPVHRL